MTTQPNTHQLPTIIQQILDDSTHQHYAYFCGFKKQLDIYLNALATVGERNEYGQLNKEVQCAEWNKLLGLFLGATHFVSFSLELCVETKLFLDTISFYSYEQMTELAPSLDDSVIDLHQGATTPTRVSTWLRPCPDCFGSLDDDLCCPSCGCPPISTVTKLICYQCDKQVNYLFPDSRCKDCTHLTPEEVVGNTHCPHCGQLPDELYEDSGLLCPFCPDLVLDKE